MSDISVIMYHYVRDIKNSSFPAIKGLELNLFVEQIQYLKKHYHFVTTEEIIDSINNNTKLPSKAVLLTFDDGYKDHYQNVFPILHDLKIQGSFYIPAKTVIDRQVLDVNKIHFILASVDDKKKLIYEIKSLLKEYRTEFNLNDFDFYFKKLANANRLDTADVVFIKRILQVELDEVLRMKMVDSLFNKYIGVSESEFAKELYMNENEIKEMLNNGMHIGCHGYNHYWWNRLTANELEKEIDLSLKFLNNLGVNLTNWTAAYPYGSHSKEVEQLLKEKKCQLAFTTEVGIANTSKIFNLIMKRLDTNDIPKSSSASVNDWFFKSL